MPEKDCLFISDIHLSPQNPDKTQLFCETLAQHAKNTNIYILGDMFDAWLGDDMIGPWLDAIEKCSNDLIISGSNIFIMPGNHDFMIGEKLISKLRAKKLTDPNIITINAERVLLTHGDNLCANDRQYQRIKPIIQSKATKKILSCFPLSLRSKIANSLQGNGKPKSMSDQLILNQLLTHNCDKMIHGHIHKSYIKSIENRQVISLNPWDTNIVLTKISNNKLSTIEL